MTSPFRFGSFILPKGEVFFTSTLSLGIVNYKPVVPGHVLVLPRRIVPRFSDLTFEEVSDLWISAQSIGKVIQTLYKATSLTFAIQDGPEAGQTVPHVHIHILPRKDQDFKNNDEVYPAIEQNELDLNKKMSMDLPLDSERLPRTLLEMEQEAKQLRPYFQQVEEL